LRQRSPGIAHVERNVVPIIGRAVFPWRRSPVGPECPPFMPGWMA
jgi:hypothetical protein